jgi:hypothetical protein
VRRVPRRLAACQEADIVSECLGCPGVSRDDRQGICALPVRGAVRRRGGANPVRLAKPVSAAEMAMNGHHIRVQLSASRAAKLPAATRPCSGRRSSLALARDRPRAPALLVTARCVPIQTGGGSCNPARGANSVAARQRHPRNRSARWSPLRPNSNTGCSSLSARLLPPADEL